MPQKLSQKRKTAPVSSFEKGAKRSREFFLQFFFSIFFTLIDRYNLNYFPIIFRTGFTLQFNFSNEAFVFNHEHDGFIFTDMQLVFKNT